MVSFRTRFRSPVIFVPIILLVSLPLIILGWKGAQMLDIFPRSTATINLDDTTIHIIFNLTPQDLQKAESISQSLNISDQWIQGLSATIDEHNASTLRSFLPATLKVSFTEQGVNFEGQPAMDQMISSSLVSSLPEESHIWATAGGTLKYQRTNTDLRLTIDNPSTVLAQSTMSGAVNIRQELFNTLWPVTLKLDRIDVEILKDQIKGEIKVRE
jgi:hypothetical protein